MGYRFKTEFDLFYWVTLLRDFLVTWPLAGRHAAATVPLSDLEEGGVRSALTARHYAVRGAEFLSEYLLLKAPVLVRARSLFVDLIDGLTPSGPV
jgi:hypothetical protein